jgi:Zn-dependent protease with chaperone function
MLAVMLFIGYFAETPDPAPPDPAVSLAIMAGAGGVMLLAAALVNFLAIRLLRRPRSHASRRSVAANAEVLLRVLLTAVFVLGLTRSALPWSLAKAWGIAPTPDSFAVQMFGVIPYVALFFAAWLPMYRLHREITPGVWTRAGFLVHKARYNLYMLLAWIPFAFLADWLGEFLIVLPALFLAAAWAFPLVLAKAWGCSRLAEGPVLDAVRQLEGTAGVRFSRVYLWEPGGGNTQNAAAVGFLPPFRYLFLTPALVRGMREDELGAVILHELGHIRKKHLLFYLFTSLAALNFAVLAGFFLPVGRTEQFILTVLLVLFHFRFVFGWLSRNMERQADLFALEKAGSARGLANALEKLGLAAGHVRLASSWHHLGIAERVDYLRRAERDPALARSHNAGVARLMTAGYLMSALLVAAMGMALYAEVSAPPPPATAPTDGDAAHWRRVARLMPDNPEAVLELAHSLARRPEGRSEAMHLAGRVAKTAGPGEVHDAAVRLLRDLGE